MFVTLVTLTTRVSPLRARLQGCRAVWQRCSALRASARSVVAPCQPTQQPHTLARPTAASRLIRVADAHGLRSWRSSEKAIGSMLIPVPHDPLRDPRQNRLLAAPPGEASARLARHLEWASMPLGHARYESGARMRHVCFPTTAIVSRLYVMQDGTSAAIAVVGAEGMVGSSLLPKKSRPANCRALTSGSGMHPPAAAPPPRSMPQSWR